MSDSRGNHVGSTLSGRIRQVVVLIKVVVVVAVAGSAGCATDPGETTAIGTAAGGVLGAGLGAIVGNQTGDAGAGLAIGTVAGATAGALIGNEFEAQEERLAYQNERLARQDERLKAGRREIESLRGAGDVDASRDWSSRGGEPRGSLRGRSTSGTGSGYVPASGAATRSGGQGDSANSRASRREVVRGSYQAPVAERDLDVDSSEVAVESRIARSEEVGSRDEYTAGSPAPRDDKASPSSIFMPTGSTGTGSTGTGSTRSGEAAQLPSSSGNSKASRAGLISEGEPVVLPGDASSRGGGDQIAGAMPSSRRYAAPEGADLGEEPANIVSPKTKSSRAGTSESESNESKAAAGGAAAASKDVASYGSAKIGGTEGCAQAEQEMQKADDVSETPDKLFHYRRALRLCPSRPEYHVKLGDLYLSLKRKADAQYEFEEALRVAPSDKVAQDRLRSLRGGD